STWFNTEAVVMKRQGSGTVAVVVGMAFGMVFTACEQEGGDEFVSVVNAALTASPANPVAFCQASGLNVIIGPPNSDTLNGTAAADCIVGLGSRDIINGNGGDDI